MANKAQVASQIRFQLEQLSSKNAHHDFEHLCRYLARARICSNVIPSTGPVSAGGDQGKDFETFVTYLRSSPISDSTFVGRILQEPIVFACSIQKEAISSKIKSDVDKIMQHGTKAPVKAIYFFSASDIPIRNREESKSWAQEVHSVDLEILDGQAISELLAERDVFWIAAQYLSMPTEIYPRAEQEDDWYIQTLKHWRTDERVQQNYADFFEIKSATRHATSNKNVKQDLPFWIRLLKHFTHEDFPLILRRSAIYEIAVASLRGLGTLIGQEEDLRTYFASVPSLENSTELEDVAPLLNYCVGAVSRNQVQLTFDEIKAWRNNLIQKIMQSIEQSRTPGQKCLLLEIRGYLAFQIDPENPQPPNAADAIRWWTQMIEIAKDAPLFPLERFTDRLTFYTRFIGNCPEYDYLTQQMDLLLSQRYGDFKAAEKCRDRAMTFLKLGKPLEAINQLHKAKIKWFAEEAIRGSLISMLVISQSYQELGLNFAAKCYALAAASIALQMPNPEIKSIVSKALVLAAQSDYAQGSWCGYVELAESGLKAYSIFSNPDPEASEIDEFQQTLFNIATMTAVTSVLDDEMHSFLEEKIKKWNLVDWLDEILQKAYTEWKKLEVPKIWNRLEEQLWGRPFGDLDKVRTSTWSELGITWKVSWENNYETTPIAEQLIAALQILLADMSKVDLCLLKTDIEIHVSIDKNSDFQTKATPSNKGRKWEVVFPAGRLNDWQDLQIKILAGTFSILAEVSLLPIAKFNEKMEDSFRNGTSMKVFVAKPYEVLYQGFVTKEMFNSASKSERKIPQEHLQFDIRENEALSWVNGPGLGYSKEKAVELLKNRYSNVSIPIQYTLKNLRDHAEFRTIIKKLRQDGWLDWHILTSINNLAVSYRARQLLKPDISPKDEKDLYVRVMSEPERDDSAPIPVTEFSEEDLRMALRVSMISTIRVLGLESRQRTPDFDGIEHFLRNRYNYWTDDINHEDPFPG
ncbi:hypothetical protein MUP01_04950 [Candidatus Bathyarchaeota archaeon]|nr:hypothetical protein [Candidatus Bathyarchaeota archaeon]